MFISSLVPVGGGLWEPGAAIVLKKMFHKNKFLARKQNLMSVIFAKNDPKTRRTLSEDSILSGSKL
jgi:hypothetical protein